MGAIRNGLKQTGKNIRNMGNNIKGKRRDPEPRGKRRGKGGSQGLGRL